MQVKKLLFAMLSGAAATLAAGPALADDDDEDRRERRKQERKTKREVDGRAAPDFPVESTRERSLARERQRELRNLER